MITGRVIGSIDSTINHPFYTGHRKLLVEKVGPDGKATGDYVIAIDGPNVGAGAGELVLVDDEGGGAREVVNSKDAPLRSIIVGIIDDMHVPS